MYHNCSDYLKRDHNGSPELEKSFQDLHSKSSISTSTDKMGTFYETSREPKKTSLSPLLDAQTSAIEVSLVETKEKSYLESLEIHPRNSTPKQDSSAVDSHSHSSSISPPLAGRNGTPPLGTTLQAIPERMTKQRHNPLLNGGPSFKSKSSPMLRGTRFCSEVSFVY